MRACAVEMHFKDLSGSKFYPPTGVSTLNLNSASTSTLSVTAVLFRHHLTCWNFDRNALTVTTYVVGSWQPSGLALLRLHDGHRTEVPHPVAEWLEEVVRFLSFSMFHPRLDRLERSNTC